MNPTIFVIVNILHRRMIEMLTDWLAKEAFRIKIKRSF